MRTRKFAIGASVLVHACAFAFVVFDRTPQDTGKEVLIEFAPSERPMIEPIAERKIETTIGTALVDPNDRSKDREPQPAAQQAAAWEALLAIDLSALRSNVMRTGLQVDGPRIQMAGFAPLEPTIHLTAGEVDSLVSKGHGYAKKSKKRGVQV
jgi:hypothetical protein